MKSPIPSKSQLEQRNGFGNIRVNVSGLEIGRAIESVVIGSVAAADDCVVCLSASRHTRSLLAILSYLPFFLLLKLF